MLRNRFVRLRLMLPVLAVLLTSCESVPKPLPPNAPPIVTKPPEIPPLPSEARQPKTPELCLPTCSDGLRSRLESWLQ
jgi:hypothetical protein